MYGIDLKVLVAMVTELYSHSIFTRVCNAYHASEIFILHTNAKF